MLLYPCGPMTWRPQYNYPAFDELASALRAAGYEVISPSELDSPEDRAAALASTDGDPSTYKGTATWGDFLSRDVKLIADGGIEGIVVLPEWETSRGARLETFVGYLSGIPIYTYIGGGWLEEVPPLELYRAWAAEPTLRIGHKYGEKVTA